MRRLPLVALLAAVSLGLSTQTQMTPAQAATARTVTLQSVAAYPQSGAETTLLGTVSSTPAGSRVDIQALRSGSWTHVNSVTTDAEGDYASTFLLTTAGTHSYRAVAPATGSLASATSPTKSFAVHRAPSVAFTAAPVPRITGSHTVGSLLKADVGTWSPTPDGQIHTRWIRDGVGRTWGPAYRLTSQDFGKRITVISTASRSGAQTFRESRPVDPVAAGTFTAKPPVITGKAEVGQTVTATVPGWSPQPATVTYQWMRGQTPITGATSPTYTLTPDDAGTELSVEARGESTGYAPATRTSAAVPVPGSAPLSGTTFGDLMDPRSTSVLPASQGTFKSMDTPPQWGSPDKLTRWDAPGAFTHSLPPQPIGTLHSDFYGYDSTWPAGGAEYVSTNSSFKNADVEFEFTGRRFAIEYKTWQDSDAMVWIDDQPLASSPIIGRDESAGRKGTRYWITVTLPERRTVKVRFAGPLSFTGVHAPAADDAQVTATPPPFTLGVLSDSSFEFLCWDRGCMSQLAAPMLSTLTGFRVWNMSEGSTGYLNDGSRQFANQTGDGSGIAGHKSSPYGSARRLAAIESAPIDALLVNGSANDQINWTPAQHRAALEKFLEDVKRVRPDLPVVISGIQPAWFTKNQTRAPHFIALTGNFAGMVGRHENVVGFIDPYTDPWLTGTGSTSNPKGDGNQDIYVGKDGVHLNSAGQAYYQGKIVDELKDLPVPQAP